MVTHVGGEAHEGAELEVVETHLAVEVEHPKQLEQETSRLRRHQTEVAVEVEQKHQTRADLHRSRLVLRHGALCLRGVCLGSDNIKTSACLSTFKARLKTHFFLTVLTA